MFKKDDVDDQSKRIKKILRLAKFSSYACLVICLLLILAKYDDYATFAKSSVWHSPVAIIVLFLAIVSQYSLYKDRKKAQAIKPQKIAITPLSLFTTEFLYGLSAYIIFGFIFISIYGAFLNA